MKVLFDWKLFMGLCIQRIKFLKKANLFSSPVQPKCNPRCFLVTCAFATKLSN